MAIVIPSQSKSSWLPQSMFETEDIMLTIFQSLTDQELCEVRKVCRIWDKTSQNPWLWKLLCCNLLNQFYLPQHIDSWLGCYKTMHLKGLASTDFSFEMPQLEDVAVSSSNRQLKTIYVSAGTAPIVRMNQTICPPDRCILRLLLQSRPEMVLVGMVTDKLKVRNFLNINHATEQMYFYPMGIFSTNTIVEVEFQPGELSYYHYQHSNERTLFHRASVEFNRPTYFAVCLASHNTALAIV